MNEIKCTKKLSIMDELGNYVTAYKFLEALLKKYTDNITVFQTLSKQDAYYKPFCRELLIKREELKQTWLNIFTSKEYQELAILLQKVDSDFRDFSPEEICEYYFDKTEG